MVRRPRHFVEPALDLTRPLSTASAANLNHDIAQLHTAAVWLLQHVGIKITHQPTRDYMLQLGAATLPNQRLTFSNQMVTDALAIISKELVLPARNSRYQLTYDNKTIFFGTSGQASHVLIPGQPNADNLNEILEHQIRPANLADFERAIQLSNALPHLNHIGFLFKPDVLAQTSDNISKTYHAMTNLLYQQAEKPFSITCHNHNILPQLIDAFPNLPKKAAIQLQACLAPLIWDSDIAASFITALQHGMLINIESFTLSAATAPASLAGSLTENLAMLLASITIAYGITKALKIKPPIPLMLGFAAFATDLKQGSIACASSESLLLQQLALTLAQHYQFPIRIVAGLSSAKYNNYQAGMEKSLSLYGIVNQALNQKQSLLIDGALGFLSDLLVFSETAMVLDHETIGIIKRLGFEKIHPTSTNLNQTQLPVIQRVITAGGHFLAEPETRQIMKSHYYYPNHQDKLSLKTWLEVKSAQQQNAKFINLKSTNSTPLTLGFNAEQLVQNWLENFFQTKNKLL